MQAQTKVMKWRRLESGVSTRNCKAGFLPIGNLEVCLRCYKCERSPRCNYSTPVHCSIDNHGLFRTAAETFAGSVVSEAAVWDETVCAVGKLAITARDQDRCTVWIRIVLRSLGVRIIVGGVVREILPRRCQRTQSCSQKSQPENQVQRYIHPGVNRSQTRQAKGNINDAPGGGKSKLGKR